ncbi:MAG: ABC transporter ATP-binding protein [Lachnospiraceae bacterium]|nr:ABC transporter ATP-binding protein [Lachnospiraceae bacterium]
MVRCDNLVKIFELDEQKVLALQGLDLEIEKGEMVTILGKSGSGKSTLLNIIGGLDTPTAGEIMVGNHNLSKMQKDELEEFRKNTIGFVWQKNRENLFSYMTVIENVMAVMNYTASDKNEIREMALRLLQDVGMESQQNKFPSQLSGGEQQRVAIAVALANNPQILLADEPTSAVDSKTAHQILKLLYKLNKEKGVTIIMVTHDTALSDKVNRTIMIADGKVSTEKLRIKDYDVNFSDANFSYRDDIEKEVHEEYSILDKANRLKLDDEMLRQAGIDTNKVKVTIVDEKIIIEKESLEAK